MKNTGSWKDKIIALIFTFAVLNVLFLYLLYEGLNTIFATQTFTAANAHWIHTQKNAVNDLYIYAGTRDESDYRSFQNRINEVRDVRGAIDEIRKDEPDETVIKEGLSTLEVSNALVGNMISAERYLGSLEYFTTSRALWEECGVKIGFIEEVGRELHDRFGRGPIPEEELVAELEWIRHLDASLTTEAQNIFIHLGKSSEWIRAMVLVILGIAVFILIFFASWVAYYWYRMTGRLESLLTERDHLAAFPKLNPMPVAEVDFNGTVTYRNPASEAIFQNMNGVHHPFLKEVRSCLNMMDQQIPETMTKEVSVGQKHYEQVIHRVDEKKVFHIYAKDVTSRKNNEKEIQRSLKEKEVLLAEIHHRVKNNLAVVAGLMEMESDNVADDRLVPILRQSISRIHSIALVHEKLYDYSDFSSINVRSYLEKLTGMIEETYGRPDKTIILRCNIEDLILNVNQAVPLAILINEVLINIYKQAGQNSAKDEIGIHLSLEEDERVRLLVDVKGMDHFSDSANTEKSPAFWMILIQTLAKQLRADITFNPDRNVAFQIMFQRSSRKGSSSAHVV